MLRDTSTPESTKQQPANEPDSLKPHSVYYNIQRGFIPFTSVWLNSIRLLFIPTLVTIMVIESKKPLVGVLAIQGAFEEHQACLEAAGCRTKQVSNRSRLVY